VKPVRRNLAAGLVALAVLALAAGPSGAEPACEALAGGFDYAGFDTTELRLSGTGMASLPPGTLVFAGSFHDGTTTVQPVLALSDDAGASWRLQPLPFRGAGAAWAQSDGQKTVWAVLSSRLEGTDVPIGVVRSGDRGRSWCFARFAGMATLNGIDFLRLYDARHGLVVFAGEPSSGRRTAYTTEDGGDSWRPLWDTPGVPPEAIERDVSYPDPEGVPPHAPVWRKTADYFAVSAFIRITEADSGYAVERFVVGGDGSWSPVATLPRSYTLADGKIAPMK